MNVTLVNYIAVVLVVSTLAVPTVAQESQLLRPAPPSVRLLQPQFDSNVPLPADSRSAVGGNRTPINSPAPAASALDRSTSATNRANRNRDANPTPSRPTARLTRSPSRRRVRLARAPNMFGDFFNAPPTLSFVVPFISFSSGGSGSQAPPEVLSPTTGFVQNPMLGGGPRLKISDNFSPIPRSRFFVQEHYFHNLFSARLRDDNEGPTTGALSARESVFVTTVGAEFLSSDGQTSLEFRLPLIHAAATNNTLVDASFGPVASQSSSNDPVGNLSVILKHVISEDQNYLMSAGVGVSIPTAGDVTGNLGHVNYTVRNETLNLVPFVAVLFSPRNNVFLQLHSQIDIPVGDDDFLFSEQPLPFYTAESGTFGSYRESINASFDIQAGYRLFSRPDSGFLRGMTAIIEFRYTAALSDATAASGSAGEFFGDSDTEVSAELSQSNARLDYLNMTFGLQLDLSRNWHLRCGQVFPLIDNNSFTAETIVQLERRF